MTLCTSLREDHTTHLIKDNIMISPTKVNITMDMKKDIRKTDIMTTNIKMKNNKEITKMVHMTSRVAMDMTHNMEETLMTTAMILKMNKATTTTMATTRKDNMTTKMIHSTSNMASMKPPLRKCICSHHRSRIFSTSMKRCITHKVCICFSSSFYF